ncbi:MAG: DUF2103 domain-containing protein [Peptococcaceae bacterium]|jgi:hypothetical protein|nr:DUF2103 domain-containing protein [Peptococcaceae bacterium]MDR2737192.1 DUF2103 domain-containing protein [Gracilibacteraceae bacterium]
MKYRHNKIKREHSIIEGSVGWLESLAACPEISDIIPGVISRRRPSGQGITFQYETKTGCKLLVKSGGSIQEVFVVTQEPQAVRDWIQARAARPRE